MVKEKGEVSKVIKNEDVSESIDYHNHLVQYMYVYILDYTCTLYIVYYILMYSALYSCTLYIIHSCTL